MHAATLIHPLIECAALVIGFCACLYLFVSLKVELRRVQKRADAHRRTVEEQIDNLATSVSELRENLRVIGDSRTAAVASHLDGPQRAQALRMLRRGELHSTVAATFELPLNEVELLAKMQKLTTGAE